MKRDICVWKGPMRCAGIAVMGMTLSSCFYVWEEPIRYGAGGPGGQQAAPAPGTLDELKAQQQSQARGETMPEQREVLPPARDPDPVPTPKPPRQTAASIPTANKVPGREGFVFSPYNNKLIDVKGFPKGTKVRDPAYPESENKFFKVP